MPQYDTNEVTRALLAKLYEQTTAKPDVGQEAMPDDRFIAWCVPGIPFKKKDFRFALRGIGGSLATGESPSSSSSASGGSSGTGGTGSGSNSGSSGSSSGSSSSGSGGGTDSPPEISAGEEVRNRIMNADNWARLVNFIPNQKGLFGEEGRKKMYNTNAFEVSGASVASVYENVLEQSQVASMPLSEEQKKRLERFRSKLTTTKKKEDLMSGEMKEVTEESKLVKRYNQYRKKYLDAAMQYNSKRLNALNSEDSAAVQDWALNEDLYRQKVEAAYDQWVSAGYKNEVEKMRAYIDQVTQRNLVTWKDELLDKMKKTNLSNPMTGASFQWTSVIPARFAFADSWNSFKFSQSQVETFKNRKTNQWDAGGGALFGIFGAAGGGGESDTETSYEVNTENFRMSFEVTQVIISRPWFEPEFLLSNAWRFPPNVPDLDYISKEISDGETPPSGEMIAYPTAALFIRDLTVRMNEFDKQSSKMKKDIDGGGTVRIGPVRLGGGYSQSEITRKTSQRWESGALRVPGMQLIGFRCKLLPKLPNPSDEVEKWS